MPKFIDIDTKPFTKPQLRQFRRELEKAGGFDELMKEKQALKPTGSGSFIDKFKDIQEYREKYLCGKYEPLREHYTTEVPYSFWAEMYQMLKRVNPHIE